eukprot:1938826-Pleurochrysis_carterae.AAC.1
MARARRSEGSEPTEPQKRGEGRGLGRETKGCVERSVEGREKEEKEREQGENEKEDKRSRKTQRNVRRGRQRHNGAPIEKDNKANKDRGTQKGGAST